MQQKSQHWLLLGNAAVLAYLLFVLPMPQSPTGSFVKPFDLQNIRYFFLFLIASIALSSCYDYPCQDPEIFGSWQEIVTPGQIRYSITARNRTDRYQFNRGPIEEFYVDVTRAGDECQTYSEVNRVVYTCQNCTYELYVDHQTLDSAYSWNIRRLMLFNNNELVDSVAYRWGWGGMNPDSHQVGDFSYSEIRGLLRYENDSILIQQ